MQPHNKHGKPETRHLKVSSPFKILIGILIAACILAVFVIKTKEYILSKALESAQTRAVQENEIVAFPIGVDPNRQVIHEDPSVDTYFEAHLSHNRTQSKKLSWLDKLTSKLAQFSWYQNLASPISRVLVVDSGERKEEVAQNFGSILRWDATEREAFATIIASSTPELAEGKFFPGHYVTHKDAGPEDVAKLVVNKFETEVLARYPDSISAVVSLEDALIIASLLEREAYDFEDMRYIAGIIWNRLFIDMNLQIDASLQYAKGSQSHVSWWPTVLPADKYISSPYNTYEHEGLPPAPIANPSTEAILAALNPKATDCIFYFHDRDGGFHCTVTYEEHVALLKQYYGKGK